MSTIQYTFERQEQCQAVATSARALLLVAESVPEYDRLLLSCGRLILSCGRLILAVVD